MRIGGSLVLIAIGAILRWAVTYHVSGVNLRVVGTILLVIGVIGLVVTLLFWGTRRDRIVRSGYAEPRNVDPDL